MMRRKVLLVMMAVLLACAVGGCGKDTKKEGNDSAYEENRNEDKGNQGSEGNNSNGGGSSTDNSWLNGGSGDNGIGVMDGSGGNETGVLDGSNGGNGGSGNGGSGSDGGNQGTGDSGWSSPTDGVTAAKPGEDILPSVFHWTNRDAGEDIWLYVAWEDDGSNMRIVFFGDGNQGTVPLTTMDGQYYYGSAQGDIMVNKKSYGSIALALESSFGGYAHMKMTVDGEELSNGLDGVVNIRPVPSIFRGIFSRYYLDPMMVLEGDEYRLTAVLSDSTSSYTVENVFYCSSIWDDEKEYRLQNLAGFTYDAGMLDNFSVSTDYNGNDRTLYVTWFRNKKDGSRDDAVQDFSSYYYRFVDHKAPADFVNRDNEGTWGAMVYDAGDADFVPVTDDFIVTCEKTEWGTYNAAQEYVTYDATRYGLYSFDGVGNCVQNIEKVVFSNGEGAQGYQEIYSYYNPVVKGTAVYLDYSDWDGYGKQSVIVSKLGGMTTYSDHSYYEGVHYYGIKEEWSDKIKEVYISNLPKTLTMEETKEIISRCGSYGESEVAALNLCCDLDAFSVFIQDNAAVPDSVLYGRTQEVQFDETGFFCCMGGNDMKFVLRADYAENALKATFYIFPGDAEIKDYAMTGLSPDQVVEKTYPLRSKEFPH